MREHLLPHTGRFYKANLHAHTTVSDGKMTPAEVKAAYKARGYAVVAFTDHDVMVDQTALSDGEFLALNGWELAINEGKPWGHAAKTYHFSLIAETPEADRQVFFLPRGDFRGNAGQYADRVRTTGETVYAYNYSPIFANRLIRAAHAAGFLVFYNHPNYSLQTGDDFLPLEGLDGMEIHNGASYSWGFGDDGNTTRFDRMLRRGHTSILPIAADDNHARDTEDPANELFTGFMMIKAETLSYTAITSALKAGNAYASQGPEIHELWVENGVAHIKTSEATEILLRTGDRGAERRFGKLTEAEFKIRPDMGYFRFEVVDAHGKRAATRAYEAARFGR